MAADYGTDLAGIDDIDSAGAEVSGLLGLAQALARRLITPRGGLIDDPNYGYDLGQALNEGLSKSDVARVASDVDAEFLKDERVLSSVTVLAVNDAEQGIDLVSAVMGALGPFTLTMLVTQTSAVVLSVEAA